MIVGLGFAALGLLFILISFREPWYSIPVALDPSPIVDQSDKLPTKQLPRTMVATTQTSKFEFPCKAILAVAFCLAGIRIVRNKWQAFPRAQALGQFSAICLAVGLSFCHLVIVDEPELSHMASWIWSQHDGLAWYGGDIYTSREYEVPGGAYDILMKDPPKFLNVVSPPYFDLDLATINDYLTWAGLCYAFWVFMGKGWAYMMLGSLLLMVGVLSTREPGHTRGLSNKIVIWVMVRSALIIIPWIAIVTLRALLVAHTIESAQAAYMDGNYVQSLNLMKQYQQYMPCLEYDSGLLLQEGILEHSLGRDTDHARFAKAYYLENDGYPARAEKIYLDLMDSRHQCVAREAARYFFRRAIINYNAGEHEVCLNQLKLFRAKFPCMPKACYLRLLIAVRADDFEMAQQSLQEIYAVVRNIGIPEARGYCTSGHQHLAQLAFDQNDVVETRRQAVYRAEQQPK
ncbi:MAG: hypothetical protein AAGA30_07960 [Planctomycetota bacterium]